MRKYLALLAVLACVSGCATFKSKTHALFCVGVCAHAEQDTEKKKGEGIAAPAPVETPPIT